MQFQTVTSLVITAVLFSGSACCSYGQDPPSDQQLEAMGLENRWEGQATLDVTRDVVSHITSDEDNVYVQSSAGAVTALHAENGRLLWTRQVGGTDVPARAAISNSKLVVIIVGSEVFGLEKFTGATVFRHRFPGPPSAIPAVDERRLYVPIDGGAVYVYAINTLSYKTRYKVLPPDEPRSYMYKFVCGEEITRPPIVGDKTIAFVSDAGSFYSMETEGGSPGGTRFQLVMSDAASNDLAVIEGENGPAALILTGDEQVSMVDMTSGTTEWTFAMGRKLTQGPIAVGAGVYVVTRDQTVTKINRDGRGGPLGRPSEVPNYHSPNVIGVGLKETAVPDDAKQLVTVQSESAVEVTEISPGSPAAQAGLQLGDIIVLLDGLETSTVDAAVGVFAELPLRAPRTMLVIRNGKLETLEMRINVREWEAANMKTLLAVGRFSVMGYDQAQRLVSVERKTGQLVGTTDPTRFSDYVINSRTDQVYLATSSGRVICIREIGPLVEIPEFNRTTQHSKITKIHVQIGDVISSAGTDLCDLESADGSTFTVTSKHAGTVHELVAQVGSEVSTGDPILRIKDDQFATYHQKPQQRPVDIDLGTEQQPEPESTDEP